jgi:hypothetical protein
LIAGYGINDGVCFTCPTNCKSCTAENQCSACLDGFFLSAGQCVPCSQSCKTCNWSSYCTECISGYTLNNYQCCPNGCLSCNDGKCWSCDVGFFHNRQDYTCVPCPASCSYCINGGCSSCQPGYFISGNECLQCISPCKNCYSSTTCQDCIVGYTLSGSTCTPNP